MLHPRSERRSIWPAIVLAVLLLLPVLYVASVGPACAMMAFGQLDYDGYWSFYRPLTWVGSKSETADYVLKEYQFWWVGNWPWGRPTTRSGLNF